MYKSCLLSDQYPIVITSRVLGFLLEISKVDCNLKLFTPPINLFKVLLFDLCLHLLETLLEAVVAFRDDVGLHTSLYTLRCIFYFLLQVHHLSELVHLHLPILLSCLSDCCNLVLEVVRGHVHLLPCGMSLHECIAILYLLVSLLKLFNRFY